MGHNYEMYGVFQKTSMPQVQGMFCFLSFIALFEFTYSLIWDRNNFYLLNQTFLSK